MATRVERLPYGIGRWSAGWTVVLVVLLAFVAVGAYAYYQQLRLGEVVTGLRDIGTMGGAPWGLYVGFVVYFVGVSFAGITVAAMIRLFGLRHLRPVARMAEVLTVIALILGAFSIIADVGQPLRAVVNLLRYARPGSPFFGTFTLVISGYLFGSLVYLYLDGRRDAALLARQPGRLQGFYRLWAAGYRGTPSEREHHSRASFWLAVAILPLLITAHSTLGFVFGLQVGRPGWFSGLQAPGFVALAGVSGVGLLIIIAAIVRRALGVQDQLGKDIFRWLGGLLLVLTLAYLYFMSVDLLTSTYAAHHHEIRITAALLRGEYAWLYWGVVAALFASVSVLAIQYIPALEGLRLPAAWPRYVLVVGVTLLVVALLLLSQIIPAIRQAGLAFTPQIIVVLTGLLIVLVVAFWATLLPLFRGKPIVAAVISGVLVNLAAIGKRYLIVVPSQTHGTLLPYAAGSYSPTWVEYSIVLGLFAMGILLFILFMKVFPILEVKEPAEGVPL
ncbi:MAG: NrfD/PsrC family molybdoenzyme membrane anchor subunit [Anaerolineales bacterium]